MKNTIYFLIFFVLSCTSDGKRIPHSNQTVPECSNNTYTHLSKLSITGDFDGDGRLDTLFQNTIHRESQSSIDSFPDNQWDSIENYFYTIEAEVILTRSNRPGDTLFLGYGGGLYCLINIGDNNQDGKDEIALVVDDYGFTNISPCSIYTVCGNQWTLLNSFKIHESAFEYEGDAKTIVNQINGFLEYRKGQWFYIDYTDWFNAERNQDTMLKPLKIKTACKHLG